MSDIQAFSATANGDTMSGSKTPSPPIGISNHQQPLQEENPGSITSSQMVLGSLSSSYRDLQEEEASPATSADEPLDVGPQEQPTTPLDSPKPENEQPSTKKTPIPTKVTLDRREYPSYENRAELSKDKFIHGSRKGHTWNCSIPVKVGKKNEVTASVFIFPRVSDNNMQITKLDVVAEVSKNLLKRLRDNKAECEIRVDTKVLDARTRQSIGAIHFHSHSMSMDDGQVNFRQDLVSCDEVRKCQSDSVTLVIEVTFITSTLKSSRRRYTISEHEDYEVIETVNDDNPT